MNKIEPQGPSQHFEQMTKSAISLSGDATNYTIAGDQHLHYAAQPKPWEPPVMLPPRAQSFVGRDEDIAWLLQQLKREEGKTLALCGPGGIGKTALTAEALTRLIAQEDWLARFPGGIFYHSFYSSPSVDGAFEELAFIFEQDPGADPRRAALRALSRRRTLLVFDGVEVLPDALPLRNLGGTHVVLLLSRRQSDAPDMGHSRTIELLSQEQGIILLQKLAGSRARDLESVERLVEAIKGYPLALQIIGSYLASRQEEVRDYLRWFEQEGLAALDQGKHQAQSVRVLLKRIYDSLTHDEQHLFAILGLLAPAPFPVELVQSILALPERSMRMVLNALVDLSVLRRPDLNYEVSHPLVHTFAKELLLSQLNIASSPLPNIITTWRERALTTFATHFDKSDRYDRITLALWQPHLFPLFSAEHLTAEQALKAAHIFNDAGFNADTQGKYSDAEPLYLRALEIHEQLLEANHPDTANSLNNLATLYNAQGKYPHAEFLYLRALEIREQLLGTNHPDTALILNNLATLYDIQGKYAEAESLYQRALAIREQQLRSTHPDTAMSLNNLAALYYAQGKYIEAEPLYQRALAIYEQQLNTTHPDMALSLNNLAGLYKSQGKYAEAEPLYQRALTIYKQLLGATHPSTAMSLNNLAGLYYAQGKYAEAEPLYQQTLAIYEQQLGTTHPDTAQSLNGLAMLYNSQGKYAEAEPLYQRALAINEQHLGATHPSTAMNLNNLATLYYTQSKYANAEPLLKRSLAIYEQQLGATHPDTAQSLNNLAAFYNSQGKYAEAEPLYQRALAINEQQLGATHPSTAISFNNLATLYYNQSKYTEAEPLYQRALAINEQHLGATHPSTAMSLNNLAALYNSQEKYAEAEPLYQRALAINEQQLGASHSDTALSLNNLAALYNSQGKYANAEPLLKRSLMIYEQMLGTAHPTTKFIRRNYTSLLQKMEHERK